VLSQLQLAYERRLILQARGAPFRLARFGALVSFVLSGFDRLRFAGESRLLNHARGVQSYCHQQRILFKDFPRHAEQLTHSFRRQTLEQLGDVPVLHLDSPDVDKEAVALDLARQHGRDTGRIALWSCQESALAYRLRRNAERLVEPRKEKVRCGHYYHYFRHEQLGLCYVRISSWSPFAVRVGLNGRRWLAQQLSKRSVAYQRRDNLITAAADVALAQRLLDAQVRVAWPKVLAELVQPVHPPWDYLHQQVHAPFYWMTEQSEWASDFVFTSARQLAAWYPRWLRHGIEALSCKDVLRYLGKKVPHNGYGPCTGEAKIDLRTRPDGTRLKFWYNSNALKFYDKEGLALRIETTINDPSGFRVYRTKEGEPTGAAKSWQQMRKGVADLPRRAAVRAAANGRLAESLAGVAEATTLGQPLAPLGRPVPRQGRRLARPLNPLGGADGKLLRALARGDYLVAGLRNRDVREALFGECKDPAERRRQAGHVTRCLALLRAHGLLVKVQKTHRYQLSAVGRRVCAALLAAEATSVNRLTEAA
jgi:hypothetical protein